MWFVEEQSQFSLGQTAQSLSCSVMEKPHTGLDDCLRILLSCFRKRKSVLKKFALDDQGSLIFEVLGFEGVVSRLQHFN